MRRPNPQDVAAFNSWMGMPQAAQGGLNQAKALSVRSGFAEQ
ncbi:MULTISPECIES: hypothetical protein [Vibrio]|nr:hypothetical protein [Vibrio furnissii]WJG24580.1 hypothetical protein QSU95_19090 [Vibrio furnissii]